MWTLVAAKAPAAQNRHTPRANVQISLCVIRLIEFSKELDGFARKLEAKPTGFDHGSLHRQRQLDALAAAQDGGLHFLAGEVSLQEVAHEFAFAHALI